MVNDEWWMDDDGWMLVIVNEYDEYDEWWFMIYDGWWMMDDEWWMMDYDDGWWMMMNDD